jgi:hypothetical protein
VTCRPFCSASAAVRPADRRDDLGVHLSGAARDHFGHYLGLARGFVRELRLPHHIANGVDAGHVGAHLAVHWDETAFHAHTGGVQAQVFAVGLAAHRHQNLISVELALAGLRGDRHHRAVTLFRPSTGLGVDQDFHT